MERLLHSIECSSMSFGPAMVILDNILVSKFLQDRHFRESFKQPRSGRPDGYYLNSIDSQLYSIELVTHPVDGTEAS